MAASLKDRVKGVSKRKLLFDNDFTMKISGKRITLSEAIKTMYPIFNTFNTDEKSLFVNVVSTYIKDFENTNLSFTDLDDLFSLASNKVFEYRLLAGSDDSTAVYSKVEKLKKQNEIIKESLATRRKDRLKEATKSGVTILDIAAEFDQETAKKKAKEERRQLRAAKNMIKKDSYKGNREDLEVSVMK